MSENWQLALFLGWLASLLLAVYLGYDRGRWQTGLLLGLLLGPLGALAAGLLTPSIAWEVARRYRLGKQLRRLHRRDAQLLHTKRQQAAEVERLAASLETPDVERLSESLETRQEHDQDMLSEQLGRLASELEQIIEKKSARKPELSTWVGWLRDQRELVRMRERPASETNGFE